MASQDLSFLLPAGISAETIRFRREAAKRSTNAYFPGVLGKVIRLAVIAISNALGQAPGMCLTRPLSTDRSLALFVFGLVKKAVASIPAAPGRI